MTRDGSLAMSELRLELRLDTLLLHLDDESEWQTIDEFWETWSPRLNDRIRQLILRCQLREAQLDAAHEAIRNACTLARRNMVPLDKIPPTDSKACVSIIVQVNADALADQYKQLDEIEGLLP